VTRGSGGRQVHSPREPGQACRTRTSKNAVAASEKAVEASESAVATSEKAVAAFTNACIAFTTAAGACTNACSPSEMTVHASEIAGAASKEAVAASETAGDWLRIEPWQERIPKALWPASSVPLGRPPSRRRASRALRSSVRHPAQAEVARLCERDAVRRAKANAAQTLVRRRMAGTSELRSPGLRRDAREVWS